MRSRHPFFRRLMWNPIVPALWLGYLGYTAYLMDFPLGRTAGALFIVLWFGLSLFDSITNHRLLDWMYSDEQPRIDDE